jgi:hypothetical protein
VFRALLDEACSLANCGLRVDDSSATPIGGYGRRPDFCVVLDRVCLTMSEAVLVVELKRPAVSVKDAVMQLGSYLTDQAAADHTYLRKSFLGIACNGREVVFIKLSIAEDGRVVYEVSRTCNLWKGGTIDQDTFRKLVGMFRLAQEVTGPTTAAACSELHSATGASENAKFGLVSSSRHGRVVYWCRDARDGYVLKGYPDKTSCEREWKASQVAREAVGSLKQYVAVVERAGVLIAGAAADSLSSKFWLKVTPLGKVALSEMEYVLELHGQEHVVEWVERTISTVESVLVAMHAKQLGHWDVKPANIVLCHTNHGTTEAKAIWSLDPLLIDFASMEGEVMTTLLFSSKSMLEAGVGLDLLSPPQGYGSSSEFVGPWPWPGCAEHDMECLFWTAVDVLSRNTFIRALQRIVKINVKKSPTRPDTLWERRLLIEYRRQFLDVLRAGKGQIWEGELELSALFCWEASLPYLHRFAEKYSLYAEYELNN